jgi:hypothetical protein
VEGGVTVIRGEDAKSRKCRLKEGESENQNRIEEEPKRVGPLCVMPQYHEVHDHELYQRDRAVYAGNEH